MKKRKVRGKKSRPAGPSKGLAPLPRKVAGTDIGSRQMHMCAPVADDGRTEVRVFATTTDEIVACAKWLRQLQVQSVAMESTGVYWIPVLEILESYGLETLLVDTRPLSRVPGRKTDITDAEWIQTLHSHGLLQGCYRPAEEISQLRSLVRQKAVLVSEQADWMRRMQKCLDQMNVRVHHAVSDAQGVTGMRILRAIVAGERDPRKLAELRDEGCHKSPEQMAALLKGHWRPDHLFNLRQGLGMYDAIGERIAVYEGEIQERMKQLTPPGRAEQKAPPLPNAAKRKAIKRRDQEEKRQALYRMTGVDLTTIDGVERKRPRRWSANTGWTWAGLPAKSSLWRICGWRPGRPSVAAGSSRSEVAKPKGRAPAGLCATPLWRWAKAPAPWALTTAESPSAKEPASQCLPPPASSLS